MKKLQVPLPSTFKFQKLYDESEYLQAVLEQTGFSHWKLIDEKELTEVRQILIENKINYRL